MTLHIAGLWRYPVKSLAGERLAVAEVTANGVAGDRLVHVRGPEGVRTSRRQFRLLGLHGTTAADGSPLVDGHAWNSDEARGWSAARPATTPGSRRTTAPSGSTSCRCSSPPTARWRRSAATCDGCGPTSSSAASRASPNASGRRELRIGEVVIALDSLRGRCPMTTVDPDTLARDPEVLKDIGRRFGGRLALNADVVRGGTIRVGDAVTLVKVGDAHAAR